MKTAIVWDVEKNLKRWRKYWLVPGLVRTVSKSPLCFMKIQEIIKVGIGLKKKLKEGQKIIDDKG